MSFMTLSGSSFVIANMSNYEISNYQKRIKTFLNSEEALPFSYKTFIAKIEKELNLN